MVFLLTISVALAAGTWGVVAALDQHDGTPDGQLHGECVTFDEAGGEMSVELWEAGTRTAGPASRETIAAGGARVPDDEGARR